MKLKIGFSPCPNDTFIFDALINKKIDTGDLEFEPVIEDVQSLNEQVINAKLDISKISYGTLPLVLDDYIVLNSGSALGRGVGPLLISRIAIPEPAVKQCVIAIPGQNTTANVLFSMAYPEATNKVFLRYDEIEDFVLKGASSLENIHSVKLGVIIHENRFTYQHRGLVKVQDLGEFWVKETGLPIPLGGIVGNRRLPLELLSNVQALIQQSIRYAQGNEETISEFVRSHAQEMEEKVMHQHIALYVNDHSLDLGDDGRKAVKKFVSLHSSINKIPVSKEDVFLP